MDLARQLEAEHSKASTTAIVNYIGGDKKRFKVLMDLFLKGEYRVTQRAAWPLSYAAIEHPELLVPYYDLLVNRLMEPVHHSAIYRNILRIFEEVNVPEKHHGTLIDICFRLIMSETEPVAVRAFAITVASNICTLYPELKSELLLILAEMAQLPQTPAITSRIKSALKKLKAAHPKV